VAALLAVTATILAVSGGFRTTVGGFRVSARSPLLVTLLAFINFTIWLSQARRSNAVESDLARVWEALNRHSKFIVAIALISTTVVAMYSTRSAAGADASGYVSQAAAWTQSLPPLHFELVAQDLPGADPWLTTPLGWRPVDWTDMDLPGVQAPTYPPGLPLLMALPHAVSGITGATSVVTFSAAVAIVATGLIAAKLGGSIAGVIAAILIGFTPIFIHQSIQPMSDVPVTAAWMLCFVLLSPHKSRSLPAGIACGIAVLIRPNLAPLAVLPLLLAQRKIVFATPVAAAGIFLAVMQALWYGSPFQSGYGATDELFAVSNILPNIGRYSRWWLATAPALLLGVFGVYRLRSHRLAQAMAAFGVLVIGAYLIYAVFDDWSYLRFLLPSLAISAVFAGIALAKWIERWPITVRVLLLFAVVVGVTAYHIAIARSLDTFKLADQLARVATVADYLNKNVHPGAVLLSGEQSGSMRYYTHRSILRWEAASAATLTEAFEKLVKTDRPIFIVLDAWEEPLFRAKLAAAVPLDWPPMLVAGTTHRTLVWRLSDGERFRRGETVDTIRLP
jgi:hypothetical protein